MKTLLKSTLIASLMMSAGFALAYDAETEIAINIANSQAQSYYNYLMVLDRMSQRPVYNSHKGLYEGNIRHEDCVENAIKEDYSVCMKRTAKKD